MDKEQIILLEGCLRLMKDKSYTTIDDFSKIINLASTLISKGILISDDFMKELASDFDTLI